MTANILDTYTRCNPNFRVVDKLPQRMLTTPSEGVANNGCDNEEANLICHVHDQIICSDITYTILDLLGTGTFGQVFRCQKDSTKEVVAIKIIKNKAAYHSQGLLEIKIARLLNNTFDPKNERHIVRLLDSFEFNNHICLVFELLSVSLLDILTQNQFRGLPLSVVQRFTRQIIAAMATLEDANIIHCDLKPENILLTPPKVHKKQPPPPTNERTDNPSDISQGDGNLKTSESQKSTSSGNTSEHAENSQAQAKLLLTPPPALILSSGASSSALASAPASAPSSSSAINEEKQAQGQTQASHQGGRLNVLSDVKVIDLGSACFEGRTMYSYIQSRFYRSPEVLLGVPYNGAIDMWSLACVCAEMYLGLPLFPGVSQHNQLTRIIEMMGCPPDSLIEGKNGSKYFSKIAQNQYSSERGYQSKGLLSGLALHPSSDGPSKDAFPFPRPPTQPKYRIKTAEEYASETNTEIPVLRKYLRYSKLNDVIMKCPLANKSRMTPEQKKEEVLKRLCFLNFLEGLFQMNPFERWTAKQAANHPFITNGAFTGQFVPPLDPKINERKLSYLMQTQHKDSRIRGGRPSSMSMGIGQELGVDNSHIFQMLQHRRQSEPVGLNVSHNVSSGMYNDGKEGPLLMRGVSVIESRGNASSPGQYQHHSLPDSNDYFQQQQQQQQRNVQSQQMQQQQQLVQSPPEQYSAYSAATPDSAWATYMMKDRASKDQTANSSLKKNNSQFIDGLVLAHSQSQTQGAGGGMTRGYAHSCDDLSQTTHSNKSRRGGRRDGTDMNNQERSNSFTVNGSDNRERNNSFSHLQQQQQRAPPQHDIGGGLPYPNTNRMQFRQDQSSNFQNQQNGQNYPQSYQYPLQQSQSMDNIHPQWLQQQQNDNKYLSTNHSQQTSPRHNYDTSNQPRMVSGSMDSTEKGGYGGSLTEVPLMMTDFGQALMRPELDERRRLHSMEQQGSGYNDQQYPNNQGGQRHRQGKHWQPQNMQGQNITRLQLSQQSNFSTQKQYQKQQEHQHSDQSHNHKNENNYNYSSSQERQHNGRMLMEASARERLRTKQHTAGSLDTTGMLAYRDGEKGETDSSRGVSFAPTDQGSPDETQNFVAQLVRRGSSSLSNTRSTSPKSDEGRRSAGSRSPTDANRLSPKTRVNSSSSIPIPKGQVGEMSESLADWDPFFSGDFEMEEQDDRAGDLVKKSPRVDSTGISDRGSTDEGDSTDVDESEWRSTGSRGHSADVNLTPEIPT
eukprot:CAMPEP_0119038234 /NCGR_PEP_ID=MMETSP1177-20130426/7001_1 /TAXON_ID=2985 /ORGANISM="Ochromonas sp, Strain CCMP1899" /LENGTH=1235 /DNA_ID=CAMNT_0007000509 /DNA_START=147 /DNA_END=3854 /DNA_ORIENTATION=+